MSPFDVKDDMAGQILCAPSCVSTAFILGPRLQNILGVFLKPCHVTLHPVVWEPSCCIIRKIVGGPCGHELRRMGSIAPLQQRSRVSVLDAILTVRLLGIDIHIGLITLSGFNRKEKYMRPSQPQGAQEKSMIGCSSSNSPRVREGALCRQPLS